MGKDGTKVFKIRTRVYNIFFMERNGRRSFLRNLFGSEVKLFEEGDDEQCATILYDSYYPWVDYCYGYGSTMETKTIKGNEESCQISL